MGHSAEPRRGGSPASFRSLGDLAEDGKSFSENVQGHRTGGSPFDAPACCANLFRFGVANLQNHDGIGFRIFDDFFKHCDSECGRGGKKDAGKTKNANHKPP